MELRESISKAVKFCMTNFCVLSRKICLILKFGRSSATDLSSILLLYQVSRHFATTSTPQILKHSSKRTASEKMLYIKNAKKQFENHQLKKSVNLEEMFKIQIYSGSDYMFFRIPIYMKWILNNALQFFFKEYIISKRAILNPLERNLAEGQVVKII